MMNNHILQQSEIDVIALEGKHQENYKRSQLIQEFLENYRDNPKNTFADGRWDGYLGFEPEPYQWHSNCYRSGYLSGVAQKWDEQFSQR